MLIVILWVGLSKRIWYKAGIYNNSMSQLFQITVMFVVNLKKSFKVIGEPEKTE